MAAPPDSIWAGRTPAGSWARARVENARIGQSRQGIRREMGNGGIGEIGLSLIFAGLQRSQERDVVWGFVWLLGRTALRRKQAGEWSLTMPTACIQAYTMTGP